MTIETIKLIIIKENQAPSELNSFTEKYLLTCKHSRFSTTEFKCHLILFLRQYKIIKTTYHLIKNTYSYFFQHNATK